MATPAELREQLIRNFIDVPRERFVRAPHYDGENASLSKGTAARQLGASFDIVAPGKMSCPYHFHHAEEEMFIVLHGEGTLRVAGEHVPIRAGDVINIRQDRSTRTTSSTPRMRRCTICRSARRHGRRSANTPTRARWALLGTGCGCCKGARPGWSTGTASLDAGASRADSLALIARGRQLVGFDQGDDEPGPTDIPRATAESWKT